MNNVQGSALVTQRRLSEQNKKKGPRGIATRPLLATRKSAAQT